MGEGGWMRNEMEWMRKDGEMIWYLYLNDKRQDLWFLGKDQGESGNERGILWKPDGSSRWKKGLIVVMCRGKHIQMRIREKKDLTVVVYGGLELLVYYQRQEPKIVRKQQ